MSAEKRAPVIEELRWIQALRGVAALMVLFYHMQPHWDLVPLLASVRTVSQWGFSGVDVFFALSGFVVFRSSRRFIPKHGIAAFIKKRLLRIYLGYWPVLLLLSLLTVYVYSEPLPPLKKIILSTLLLYPNIWDNWLVPAWSLTMEIYFYLWVALLALVPRNLQIRVMVVGALLLIAWGGFWLVYDTDRVLNGQQPWRYALTGLGVEFLAGAMLAGAYERSPHFFRHPLWAVPVCLCLCIGGLWLGSQSSYFDRVEVLRAGSYGIMALAVLYMALTLEQTRWLTPPRWLVAVGDASYSLYLLHVILLDASGRIRFTQDITSPQALLIFMLLLPLVIVLLSFIWYYLVEQPVRKALL